jgi:hypothetical protein
MGTDVKYVIWATVTAVAATAYCKYVISYNTGTPERAPVSVWVGVGEWPFHNIIWPLIKIHNRFASKAVRNGRFNIIRCQN